MKSGIELELFVLLIIQTTFISAFAKFETETPLLRKLVKWFVIDAVTIGLYYALGHWAILFPILGVVPGIIVHFRWCKKNKINPWKATPRKKYFELRGWKWEE